MVVTVDEAVDRKEDGEDNSQIEKILEVWGDWTGDDTGEVVQLIVRKGCHGD